MNLPISAGNEKATCTRSSPLLDTAADDGTDDGIRVQAIANTRFLFQQQGPRSKLDVNDGSTYDTTNKQKDEQDDPLKTDNDQKPATAATKTKADVPTADDSAGAPNPFGSLFSRKQPIRQKSSPELLVSSQKSEVTSDPPPLRKLKSERDMDVIDEKYVVHLKFLLAEAKSEADIASYKSTKLIQCNADLERRLSEATERIGQLESELELHTTFVRENTKDRKHKRHELEESNSSLRMELASARMHVINQSMCQLDSAEGMELAVMRRRVEDLERQNRLLRSELIEAGRELDDHRSTASGGVQVHVDEEEEEEENESAHGNFDTRIAHVVEHVSVPSPISAAEENAAASIMRAASSTEIHFYEDVISNARGGEDEEGEAVELTGITARSRPRIPSATSTEMHMLAVRSVDARWV